LTPVAREGRVLGGSRVAVVGKGVWWISRSDSNLAKAVVVNWIMSVHETLDKRSWKHTESKWILSDFIKPDMPREELNKGCVGKLDSFVDTTMSSILRASAYPTTK
jgi:hypothetical protein